MPLIFHTGLHEQIYYHFENKDTIFQMGDFNDVVDVDELIFHRQ